MDRPLLMPRADNSTDGIASRMARQSLFATRKPCEYCGDKYPAGEMTKTETGYLCKECLEKGKTEPKAETTGGVMETEKKVKTFHCAYCGNAIGKGNMTKVAGKWACNECGGANKVLTYSEKARDYKPAPLGVMVFGHIAKTCLFCPGTTFKIYNDGAVECSSCGAIAREKNRV